MKTERSALKASTTGTYGQTSLEGDTLRAACLNAAQLEWTTVVREARCLSQRRMNPAEMGVRLFSLYSRVPSLLSEHHLGYSLPDIGVVVA